MRIGVLALQGDFAEHIAVLRRMGGIGRECGESIEAEEIRLPDQLAAVDGLIIPGGESTTIGKLMADCGLLEPLRRLIGSGMPVFGTCAGAIVLHAISADWNSPCLASWISSSAAMHSAVNSNPSRRISPSRRSAIRRCVRSSSERLQSPPSAPAWKFWPDCRMAPLRQPGSGICSSLRFIRN